MSHRILILGNSGSGKTTMARSLQQTHGLAHLDLDAIAWSQPGIRRPLAESESELVAFFNTNERWVIEGSYASLAEAVLPECEEFRFLNPGVDACVANCKQRPWEPEKYASMQEQNERLAFLLEWVRQYEARDDEYGLKAHRQLFESFAGNKQEYTSSSQEQSR
jgi:adenylate kinase family enzyme